MAKKAQKLGSIRRFGSRYGRNVKHKLAKIEAIQKGKHQCPYCYSLKAKRLSTGIWSCGKCGSKFTGKAYSIKKVVTEELEEEEPKEGLEEKEGAKEKEE
jgi:large subunit ribosomal protein L37Ae